MSNAPTPPPYSPEPGRTPAAQTPPAYAGNGAVVKRGLSLTSFILGIVSVVGFFTSWIAVVVGIVAVVLGFIGRSREPGAPRWMALTGIILGFVGIVIGIVVLVAAIALVGHMQQNGQLNN